MQTYEIRFPDAQAKPAKIVKAVDVCEALLIVQENEQPRAAELWADGEKVCELASSRVGDKDIWLVGQDL